MFKLYNYEITCVKLFKMYIIIIVEFINKIV